MGIKFIYGRAGVGKSYFCLQSIKKRIDEKKEGKFILIVPEQFTFRTESNLLKFATEKALLQTEVLSFKRMAHRVFSECGGASIIKINESGRSMIIYKVLQELDKELKIFNKASKQNGFIEVISTLITEFKKYNVTPEILEDLSKSLEDRDTELKYKLEDLKLIYSKFDTYLHENYIDSDDELTMLAGKLSGCTIYDKTEIWIDEFTTFTPQQYEVIKILAKKAKNVYITLVGEQWNNLDDIDNTDLFNVTKNTEKRILRLMEENRIPFDGVIDLNNGIPYRLRNSEELAHLERYFYSYPFKAYPKENKDLTIYKAANSYEEIEEIAKNIKELVRDEGYRYKDISLVCRNIEDYEKITAVIFNEYEIPYYIDKKKDILNNPFVILITSLFELQNKNWNYESMFKYLKTGLTGIDKSYIDIIENYVLANGIKKANWLSEDEWEYYPLSFGEVTEEDLKMKVLINEIRDEIRTPLINFYKKTNGKRTVREFCEGVYDFLIEIKAIDTVKSWIDKFSERGLKEREKEYSQIVSIVMEVLDQAVQVMSQEKMDLKKFSIIINGGLEKYELGLIPLSLDEVTIGDIARVRSKEIKILFLVGVNDGVIPAAIKDEGILSDKDRDTMKNRGIPLASDTKVKAFEEQLLVYTALSFASEKLIISYPMADFEGKSLRASIIIPRLKKIFPKLIEESDISRNQEKYNKVISPTPTFNNMIEALRRNYDDEEVEEYWGEVYNWYKNHEEWHQKAQNVERALSYTNMEDDIDEDKVRKLYSTANGRMMFSVSRLEKYAQCPFSYYVQYGLKAKDRKIYEFSAPDLGSFMHEILDGFTNYVKNEKLNWSELNKERCTQIVSTLVDKKLEENQGFILNSSKRYKYFTDRFKRILSKSVSAVSEHMKRSTFEIYKNEFEFSSFKDAEPIKIKVNDGEEVFLVGRVDRVDVAEIDGESYIRVIDYKSGSKKFDLTKLYHGLQIQLLVYLDALIKNSKYFLNKNTLPGAILYFRIDDPLISVDKRIAEEEIEKKVLSSFKMDGLVLKDPKIIKAMDDDPGLYSVVIPAGIKKDGEVSSSSSVATEEQFEVLRNYVNHKIKELCSEMLKGNIKINPAKENTFTYCEFCDYSSVCQFDPNLKDNKYKLIKLKKKDEVWEDMNKVVSSEEKGGE
ncbi:helicase-exonuclease AddAB subunit AddB [Clostridium paridis]|uniref:ATP-dependent helicase/deoxyribonuclease subunit B n=1 Tax=Clostridium paridis TaxID=2803863 RepID=A0A937FHR2_9CLOT|nr:helicase-exonuclease AddAB subunit AddB [Clostridium paridis]MBL4933604.1 helicase-exonuclease AddAB subunit AddB [Clostridium paridis]